MIDRRSVLSATPLLAASAAFGATRAAGATDPANAALLRRYIELKNAHDVTHCDEIYAEDYVEHSGRNPSGLPALIKNWMSQFAGIPDVRLTLEDEIFSGDKVVARITYSGTHTRPFLPNLAPTGRAFTFGTIDIWRVAQGKFAEHWDQVDFAGLARQLQPSPPSGTP
ncbi:MAG: ester cyclase [Methylobacteriaceae bacterium]|nr:ester cyclase [Methylobacteriaceae bacterium]